MQRYNCEGYPDPTAAAALDNATRAEKEKGRKPCVFICSKYAGDIHKNTQNAINYMKYAVSKGTIPFAPHLIYPLVLDDNNPSQRNLGLSFGLVWLGMCDEIWVFGSYLSAGMQSEINSAKKRHIPIRYFTENCEEEYCK